MDAEPQKNRPTPDNATLSQARKSKALLGLKYSRARGTPTIHPRFHPGPGSPKLIGLTSRIAEKSLQVALVSHVPVAPYHPELTQEDTSSPDQVMSTPGDTSPLGS